MAKLEHYMELSDAERDHLARLEEVERDYRRREVLTERDDAMADIMVVKSGWVYGSSANPDGSEFVAELYLPGDFIGINQIGFFRSPLTYAAATDAVCCPFPKVLMAGMMKAHPRLVALIFSIASIEHSETIDRMRAIGRMGAREALAIFLLQMLSRLRITAGRADGSSFDMPLSQEMIGNMVGLSMVSVNRAFRQLEDEGHIRRDGRRIEVLAPKRLGEEVDFMDRHQSIDTSWFP
ncbi:Crp/Fnr family transcriptional regulator [Aureimonas psammosilenae]|uniref:Crp/Fnr family transcriptional regulator n=1 Tax=Aureimonas psammosilenae TaxID=2495496 RepID=UPI00186A0274|nr:Crp/Fnr family transcriptional regulator [Aureimonas psammosilenae]